MDQTCKLHIHGMTCINCQKRIDRTLRLRAGVRQVNVSYEQGTAEIVYDDAVVAREELIVVIEREGYKVIRGNANHAGLVRTACLLAVIAALFSLLQMTGVLNLLAPGELADAQMSYGMLFVIGLITSVHCVSMCGGVNLSQSLQGSRVLHNKTDRHRTWLPAAAYNAGRICSYTAIGFVLGLASFLLGGGSTASMSTTLQGILKILAGICMVVMGINMLGLFPWLRRFTLRMPVSIERRIGQRRAAAAAPFIVGVLNGFMPCGPLQAMWVVAFAAGNPVSGALSMFFFSIGTVPLMLGLGSMVAALGRKFTRQVMTAGSVLVVVLGLAMFSQGTALAGWQMPMEGSVLAEAEPDPDENTVIDAADGKNDGPDAAENDVEADTRGATDAAEVTGSAENDAQVIYSTLEARKYPDITVQAGVPVRWVIDAPQGSITGCNYRMVLSAFGIAYSFENGENVIEFTPTEEGTYPYTCWMGMIRGTITVTS